MKQRAQDFYARPEREVPPLPAAVEAALQAMPPALAADVRQHRAQILAEPGVLGSRMRYVEAQADSNGLPAACVAELWAWVSFLAIVRGYRNATTVAGYARSVSLFLEWAARTGCDYAAVTLPEFDSWQKWLFLRLKHGARWRSRQAASVRSFYDWRHTRGLGPNCAEKLRSPRINSSLPRKYSIPQLRDMLSASQSRTEDALRVRDKAILLLLLSAGLRREELVQLNLEDLDLGKSVGVVRIHGKGAKQRDVSFEGPCVDALRAWLFTRDNLGLQLEPQAVFVSTRPPVAGHRMGPRALEGIIARCARESKLREWGVHRFRITFATALYDAGHEIEEIRIVMGHESIETTRGYLAVSERARRTRLSSTLQHQVLGTRRMGQPLWVQAALGGPKS